MNSSNVAQLVAPQTPLVERREHIQGPDQEAEFLSLRLLNKRGRVRLSPVSIDYSRLPGKSTLFAVGNAKGYFAAAVSKQDNSHDILVASLRDLRATFESGKPDPEPFLPFTHRSPFTVPGTPIILKFALNDERLLVGFLEGPILVYNTNDFFVPVDGYQPNAIFTFPGDASTIPRDISPNPGDSPELVAIMRGVHGQEPGHQIDIIDIQSLKHVGRWQKGNDPNVSPVSLSWSPKGKQIAIGLQCGDMVMYSPQDVNTPKSHISKPHSTPPDASSLLSITWLSNSSFYTVFSIPEASSTLFNVAASDIPTQTHFISTHDFKSHSAIDVELRDPCPPFGASRPPGPLSVVLRNWAPTKFILFCGGGASADIGVLGADDDHWANFTLEETSTPALPLDEELNDLALLGLEVDLTSTAPISMSQQPDDGIPDLPPSPILYAYASDGTVVAWHILNSTGQAYSGMKVVDFVSMPQGVPPRPEGAQAFEKAPLTVSPPASAFTPSSPLPAPASKPSPPPSTTPLAPGFGAFGGGATSHKSGVGFGSASTFGRTPAFGATGFGFGGGSGNASQDEQPKPGAALAPAFGGVNTGQPKPTSPAFGTTGFGGASAAPAFGTTGFGAPAPAFGQTGFGGVPAKPAGGPFGSGGGGGFAAFATQGSSSFGTPVDAVAKTSSAFGSGSTFAPRSVFSQTQASAPVSAFGSGGVGQAGTAKTADASSSSIFGQKASAAATLGSFGSQKDAASVLGRTGFDGATTPPSRGDGGFSGFGALGDALGKSPSPARFGSPPGSPTSPACSPPDSPELRPASRPAKPTSSYLKPAEGFASMNKPSEGVSAFGGGAAMKSSSSFIKPAEGFGAMALAKAPVSPFGQQKPASSAFGTTGFSSATASSSSSTVTPTFGSTSALGHTGPVFGTSLIGSAPQPAAVEPPKPIIGGFGAFSASGGGFAAFASPSPGKSASFSDILASGEADRPKPNTTPLVFTAPSPSPSLTATSVSATSGNVSSARAPGTRGSGLEETGSTAEPVSEDKPRRQEVPSSSSKIDEPAFDLLSLRESALELPSSTTPPMADSSSEKPDIAPAEENVDESKKEVEEGEEVEETPSEPFSLTDDSLDESGSDEAYVHASLPTIPKDSVPQSTPPQTPIFPNQDVETPKVEKSSPPPQSPLPAAIVDTNSTTPPGSPVKPTKASPLPTPATQPSVIIPPFGVGMGRPSSRPLRSSPLASAPILSAEDDDTLPDVPTSNSALPTSKLQPAEPKVLVGQQSPSSPASPAPPSVASSSASKSPRSTTPPILSVQSPVATSIMQQPRVSPTELKFSTTSPAQPRVASPVMAVASARKEVEDVPQHPMQIEFLRAYQEMTQELVQLYKKVQETTAIRPVISEPRGMEQFLHNDEMFAPGQYSHGDLKTFTKMIGNLQKNVAPLIERGNANKSSLRDLENLALISETRREEVSRWLRARQDPDFAKTVKPRTLGPEHSENQICLRKAVQATRDRVQQCEDEMESLKKRLEQHRLGKVGLRPPTLDTIDRTCRNIQLALDERIKALEQLQARIDALSLRASQTLRSQARSRPRASEPSAVTPPFASVAAAALNSERSSLKLKSALLAARKEPLLTTKVTKSEYSRQIVSIPQRPEWKLPLVPPLDTSALPQSPSFVSRRGGRTGRRHIAVPLKEAISGSMGNSPTFDWGLLPKAAPMDKLSMDVRPRGRNFAKHVEDGSERNQETEDDYKGQY